ncbi:MAG: hypothetical protein AB1592_01185 [Pseudomonadota bacterium]
MSAPGKSSPKHGAGNTIGTYQDSKRPEYDEAEEKAEDAQLPHGSSAPSRDHAPKSKPE